MSVRHLITGEFPPQPGGVSDYVWGVAEGLARAGEVVHVWCPSPKTESPPPAPPLGVHVHRTLGRLAPPDLRRVGRELDSFPPPRRLLLQWVPHSFGLRSLNLPFCLWLWSRVRQHGDDLEIMVHEPYVAFSRRWSRQNVAAAVHRLMTVVLLRAATRVWVSTPAWARRWRRYALGRKVPFAGLAIPSSVPVVDDPGGVEAIRTHHAPGNRPIVGHFGTYRPAVASLLAPILASILERSECVVLLLGRGGAAFRSELVRREPRFEERVHATDGLEVTELSRHILACDVMVQPFPDGINGRQSSASALLAHGRAVVTTTGASTEPIWLESDATALSPAGEWQAAARQVLDLLADEPARIRMGRAARELYQSHFDMRHTIAALRATDLEIRKNS